MGYFITSDLGGENKVHPYDSRTTTSMGSDYDEEIEQSGMDFYTWMLNLRGEDAARFNQKESVEQAQRELAYAFNIPIVKIKLFGEKGSSHSHDSDGQKADLEGRIAEKPEWGKGALTMDDRVC